MDNLSPIAPHLIHWQGFLLGRVAAMCNRVFDQALAALGIAGPHLGVLIMLEQRGPQVQARLSDPLQIDKATMTRLINDLQARGLAQRVPKPGDRRAVLVQITADGQRVVREATAIGARITADLFGVLTPDEQQMLQHMLLRLADRAATFDPLWPQATRDADHRSAT